MVKFLAKIMRYWKFVFYSVWHPVGHKWPIPEYDYFYVIPSVYAFISIGIADILLITTTSIVLAAIGLVASIILIFFRFELSKHKLKELSSAENLQEEFGHLSFFPAVLIYFSLALTLVIVFIAILAEIILLIYLLKLFGYE